MRLKQIPRLRAGFALVLAPALLAGAFATWIVTEQPNEVQITPVELAVPALAPDQLGQWCVDRRAQGMAGLSTRARNWLTDCIAVFGAGLTPGGSPSASPSGSPTAQPTPSSSQTGSTPSTSPSTSSTSTPGGNLLAGLPRIPWEGGSDYWKQFPNAVNWTDPSFFPIGVWYNGISNDSNAQWDKAHGVNFYIGMIAETDFSLFERNQVYWLGEKLNSTFKDNSPYWPGVFLDDEVDGWKDPPSEGFTYLQSVKDQYAGSGKFFYANYTSLVIMSDMKLADQERYVNGFTDVVSVDQYFYTVPFCSWTNYRGSTYAVPIPQSTCRTASSYGKALNSLTIRDSVDNKLQPRWYFVENLNGGPGGDQPHIANITPGQLKGAAMNTIINEARGLMWFNQSLSGPCRAGSALRQAQVQGPSFCGYAQIEAMGEVNNFIRSLAPVINTQSYEWSFGAGLDTMLKWYNGSAHVFAMTDGTAGQRTFTLPAGLAGAPSVEVVGEGRTIPVSGGTFTDTFAAEYSYHVYKITP